MIMAVKSRQESLSGKKLLNAEVVNLYNSRVKVSSGEAVNLSYIQSATNVWEAS